MHAPASDALQTAFGAGRVEYNARFSRVTRKFDEDANLVAGHLKKKSSSIALASCVRVMDKGKVMLMDVVDREP